MISLPIASVGVEEEYFIYDSASGELRYLADDLVVLINDPRMRLETHACQVEFATSPCASVAQVRSELTAGRELVATAAGSLGAGCLSSGTPAWSSTTPPNPPNESRLAQQFHEMGLLGETHLVSGLHIHIAPSDLRLRAPLALSLRGWIPFLTAYAANSPLWFGVHTGYQSFRYIEFSKWPSHGPNPPVGTEHEYWAETDALVGLPGIDDRKMVYWLVRLSSSYPTVEVRCLDAQLSIDDTMNVLDMVLRIVCLESMASEADRPRQLSPSRLRAEIWGAARNGASTTISDPVGPGTATVEAVARLVADRTSELPAEWSRWISAAAHTGPPGGASRQIAWRNEADLGRRQSESLYLSGAAGADRFTS